MRHFRIKETIIGDSRDYVIQYTTWFLFIIKYWKTYNKIPYNKYEDALLEAKKVINLEKDYTKISKNKTVNYHYVDAFRLSRNVGQLKTNLPRKDRTETNRFNRSTFIPKNIEK